MRFKLLAVIGLFFGLFQPIIVMAGPSTVNYELQQYGFGAGGTDNSSTVNYGLFGVLGETDSGSGQTINYSSLPGLTFTMQANVPAAPSWTNPATNYDRLLLIIGSGDNPDDTTFAVAISDDNFATTQYIQSDFTIGPTLGSEDWLTYSGVGSWNDTTGRFISGLTADTTYQVKVKAKHGDFTESGWSPTATESTDVPSLTFGVSSSSISFNNLNSGNSYTDNSKTTVLTTSTNAYNGYSVYGRVTGALTSGSNQIANYLDPNSAPTTWAGTGFGYTTDDNDLAGGTTDRFTNGGPKYAGFGTSSPGDPVADHSDAVESSAIINEQFTVSYRVTASNNTVAGDYRTNVIYVVVPVY